MDGPVPTLVFGAVLLIMGVFVARPYCRFLCPYGVLLGFMSRFSWRHATITPTDCIQCRLCEDSCPFDAIVKPTPAELPESREKGVRRLALIILAMPLAIGLGAWAASRLDSVVARADSRVAIAERVSLEDIGAVDGTILESDSFRETGESTATLIGTSLATRKTARIGGWILGGFVGAIVCMRLMGLSMYRKVKDYQPDRELCLSCARCFSSCPHEQQLRKRGSVSGEA
jgi:ferredoxin